MSLQNLKLPCRMRWVEARERRVRALVTHSPQFTLLQWLASKGELRLSSLVIMKVVLHTAHNSHSCIKESAKKDEKGKRRLRDWTLTFSQSTWTRATRDVLWVIYCTSLELTVGRSETLVSVLLNHKAVDTMLHTDMLLAKSGESCDFFPWAICYVSVRLSLS